MGYRFLRVDHFSLKQQPLHGHTTRVLHDDQDQRAARIFGISKPIAGRMTTAFAGTPSFTAGSQSRTVEPSTAPRTTLSARAAANHKPVVHPQRRGTKAQVPLPRPSRPAPRGGTNRWVCWAVRTGSFVEEKCSLQVERGGEPRGDPQVRRQFIEELLYVPVHHDAVANWRRWTSQAKASWPR